MTKSENNGNLGNEGFVENGITADLVYGRAIEQSSSATTIFFSNKSSINLNIKKNTRNAQESLLMGDNEDFLNEKGAFLDHKIIKILPPKFKPENETNLPNSCFKIFASGVVNNLKEIAKCFGVKR